MINPPRRYVVTTPEGGLFFNNSQNNELSWTWVKSIRDALRLTRHEAVGIAHSLKHAGIPAFVERR